jgi:CSLREA domain-containing protein
MTPEHRLLGSALAALLALTHPAAARATVLRVTTLDDVDAADGNCSLREAIVAANTDAVYRECPAGAGADEIEIGVAGTIALAADLVPIEQALTIRGLGSDVAVIDGGGTLEILHFTDAAAGNGELLRIESLQLTGGSASEGGAIFSGRNRALEVVDCLLSGNRSDLDGGAVFADRPTSVEVSRSSLVANTSGNAGGAMAVHVGVAVTVVDSTFEGNAAESGPGGALYALSTDSLVVRQSTFSNNSSTADGGGLAAVAGPLRLESSTVVGNLADADGNDNGDGGGLSVAGAVNATLVDSILAGNADGTAAGSVCPDGLHKLGATATSEGFNLVGIDDCLLPGFPSGQPNANGDLVGTAAAPIDPLLGTLADNGGPTATHLPLPASPAVDQGSCPGAAGDQRGYGSFTSGLRIVDDPGIPDFADGCDIGSVEVGGVSLATLVFADGFEGGDTSRWSSEIP